MIQLPLWAEIFYRVGAYTVGGIALLKVMLLYRKLKRKGLIILALMLLPSSICNAQDFSLELIKCRASLNMVIAKANVLYDVISTQVEGISTEIERLRVEKVNMEVEDNCTTNWEKRFKRKITCIHISIDALEKELRCLTIRKEII